MKRRQRIMVVAGGMVGLPLICCGLGLLLTGETLLTTGVEAFFGQVRLTRESGPMAARAYVSNELLLGNARLSEVAEASLILLPQEVYFWDPSYVGFARAVLTEEEALQLLGSMASGHLFSSPDTRQVLCVQRNAGAEAKLAACEEGPQWQAIHRETRLSAELDPGMSALQLQFDDGRLAEYRLYSANGLLAYSAVEFNQPAVEGYFPASDEALQLLAARAVVEPTAVLWPEQTADEANAHASRLLGRRYLGALDFLHALEPLRSALGRIREIRPAAGGNWSSTWMDSSSLQLLLRVTGDHGEAVVMVRGDECWAAEMMYQARLYDLTHGFNCPGT
jgi:hypothetical protein